VLAENIFGFNAFKHYALTNDAIDSEFKEPLRHSSETACQTWNWELPWIIQRCHILSGQYLSLGVPGECPLASPLK